ncbi:nucleotidyltransferase domain-containing protein [Segatella copri]|uniref:Nucleotidyltransferase family protein n=1 Tax=Segatella copri TaxID=165179 RepID=A0AAW5UH48_9BACT|nr:nucleotidyltransferase family protein [Segatella copri]MCW4110209.1 nucleotidyltransferase family protein [Segatella copri]MCW4120411.1 nucleotidyltransferase family protein [Segatella copri]MCW4154183.1 nucleotidyltransferase family protein [Segatella copri]
MYKKMIQHQIFFDFLRFSIGSESEIPDSLIEADWKELYRIAQKQCLVGSLFDGIQRLPSSNVGISWDLLLQWMAQSKMLEKTNVRLNDAAFRVSEWFRKKGFRTCILKGQGNALMYPNPYSRTPGDIDIWVEGGDNRVISFVRSISPHEKACYHHIEFPSYKGVEVEVHYRPSFLLCFWHNRKLQKYYERVKEKQFSHRVMLGEQGEVAIPTVEFNLIFQLTHIYAHLMNEGIGLRQLLDYYFVLQHADIKDLTELQRNLKHFGLWKFAGAIMYIMHEVFGMPASRLIVPLNEKYGNFVLNEVLEAGNFGSYDKRNRFGKSQLGHNLQRVYRDIRLIKYFPAEALSEPIFRVWHFFWRMKNKK